MLASVLTAKPRVMEPVYLVEIQVRTVIFNGKIGKFCCNCLKNLTVQFYHAVMCPKDADRMAKSGDPDQTASEQSDLKEQSDLGVHYLHGVPYLHRPVCPNTADHYGNKNVFFQNGRKIKLP